MPWSFKLARIAGIDVYVHATFFILLIWIGLSYWNDGQSLQAAAAGISFFLALFGCVVLHEFGHALTARRYGIRTRDITLLPIGGLARLERMPEDPRQELWVALAGPAVNAVIAILLLLWLRSTGEMLPLSDIDLLQGSFLDRLAFVNIALAGFNLLPAFPMDGGRVLRALLATRMNYARATRLAASLGQAMAIFFGLAGLMGNPVLVFIALFVWIGAASEAGIVEMRASLVAVPVSRVMLTDFHALAVTSTLQDVVDLILSGSQQDFPVVADKQVAGIVSRATLVAALGQHDRNTPVAQVMRRDFTVVDADDMLAPVLVSLQGDANRLLPVTSRGRLVGLLTMENVGEFLMIQSAERPRQRGLARADTPPL